MALQRHRFVHHTLQCFVCRFIYFFASHRIAVKFHQYLLLCAYLLTPLLFNIASHRIDFNLKSSLKRVKNTKRKSMSQLCISFLNSIEDFSFFPLHLLSLLPHKPNFNFNSKKTFNVDDHK